MALFRVAPLPDEPLAASAAWHAEVLPALLAAIAKGEPVLVVAFPPAGHAHLDWRRAAIATLAREKAPVRINGIASDDEAAILAAHGYLETAEAITGQYFPLDGIGAGLVV